MADILSFHRDGPEADEPILKTDEEGGVLCLTLSAPPANTLSMAMLTRLHEALDAAALRSEVRVIVLASTGNVFCAGHDLKELTLHRADDDGGRGFFEETMRLCSSLMQKITALPVPVIAEVDGLATAAGCQLVASCDLAIATDTATFCTPGVNIGLFCSTPMVAVTRAAHRKQAMEMLLTGETIDASTAKDFGLINRIVPKAYLRQVMTKYCSVIASKSPLTLKIGKAAFYQQITMPIADAYDVASQVMVDNLMTADAQEGISAFLEKRQAIWRGE